MRLYALLAVAASWRGARAQRPIAGRVSPSRDGAAASNISRHNQISHATQMNRYPFVYERVRALRGQRGPLGKVLVFGCSTGEEVVSVADLFPEAMVVGVDVDEATLAAARALAAARKLTHRTFFFNSLEYPLHAMGSYDVVFANSVLCRHPGFSTRAYPFDTFAETVALLVMNLRRGGVLAAVNGNYRVMDAPAAHALSRVPLSCPGNPPAHSSELPGTHTRCCTNFVPLHARDGTQVPLEDHCIYTRRE
mmetsp:Transcript_2744/g.8034  ORF Transcript_2744/g.8034 Transcript_2744/m.8034 type:complete len:251 (+) Transcript_2744:481-1233(+)|eukprot:CAMPEP_0119284258 /NCGR_PEP_ID=MMETSP1329-20130426/29978_1 /TAXON_ID=114041 /ORGANISM="Genus nov. species nov., Strain RCC1024" /LENGTH=250 /DNA_ID=CAMNT_0007284935 /DNA_START=407 /DNA_END=1162 /DNA_ORIENTATION=-